MNKTKLDSFELAKNKRPNTKKEFQLKEHDEKNEENDSDNIDDHEDFSEEDNDDFKDLKKDKTKKENKNIGLIAKTLLEEKKQSLPFKKEKEVIKQDEEHRTLLSKKRKKIKQRKLGYLPDTTLWNSKEKELVKCSTRGVVKLFNSIFEIKRKFADQQKHEVVEREKKSKNFLMMHDLVAPTNNKSFREDE
jgi:hypothetical protein